MIKIPHRTTFIIGLTLSALCLFIACQSQDAALLPGDAAIDSTPTTVALVSVNQDAAIEESDSEPASDECILCHIEKQLLIDTAKPEEEVIAENEGAG